MKVNLTLTNPLFNNQRRKLLLSHAVQRSAVELESELKQAILKSKPSGRLYKRGKNRFHRASAKGQPPAVDSGSLINSVKSQSTSPLKASVSTNKSYAKTLDNKEKLNRPFFSETANKFKAKFKANIQKAIQEIIS